MKLSVFNGLFVVFLFSLSQFSAAQTSDEEIQKNKEIVIEKSNYVHTRTLDPADFRDSYSGVLDKSFIDTLYSYKFPKQRWLDVGAGEGMALINYLYSVGGIISAVGITVESDWRYNAFREQAAKDFPGRFHFFKGKYFEDSYYTSKTLGHFDIITDVYGAFSYSSHVDVVLQKIGDLLKVGGHFYTRYMTDERWGGLTILDADGKDLPVTKWLASASCMQIISVTPGTWVQAESKSLHMIKTCDKVSVPALKLIGFKSDSPPIRKYEWSIK